jgi:signal transduction histidine kinase
MNEKKHGILVVDDERENLMALRRVFRKDYEIHMAGSGPEALAMLGGVEVSCVISDQRMPEMTGVELLTQVRSRRPDVVRMILTGYTDVEDIIASINSGHIYRFITKPWSKEDLEVTIRRALDHYEETLRVKMLLRELEQKNRELMELDRMKSEFMTICSHELRTPLVKISGYTDLLIRGTGGGELAPKQQKFLNVIREGTDRLVEVTNHIMDATRLEQPTVELEMKELQLGPLLERIRAEMEPLVAQRRQKLELQAAPDLPPMRGAEQELYKAVMNVVMNAVRFTPDEGSITIVARPEAGGAEIAVTDTGIGIDPGFQEKIFDKFFAIKSSDYHFSGTFEFLSGGMGLGLAIARKLVQAHGGSISVQSQLNHGSTFRIWLPAAPAAAPAG